MTNMHKALSAAVLAAGTLLTQPVPAIGEEPDQSAPQHAVRDAQPESLLDHVYVQRMAPASVLPPRFAALQRAFRGAEQPQEKSRVLEAVLEIARETADKDAASAMGNYVAFSFLNNLREPHMASHVFRLVGSGEIGGAQSPRNVIDAWRMVGQLAQAKRPGRALDAYKNAIDVFESAEPEHRLGVRQQYLMSLTGAASVLSRLGEDEETIGLRQKAIGFPDALLDDRARRVHLTEIARAKSRLNPGQEAYNAYERVLREFPEITEDGEFYYFRYEQLNALGLKESDPAYTDRLEQLWLDPALEEFDIQRCRVGHRLASIQRGNIDRYRNEQRNIRKQMYRETLTKLIAQLDDVFATYDRETLREHSLEHIYALSLAQLARQDMHDGFLGPAIDRYERFIRLFPDHQMTETIDHRIARLEQKLASRSTPNAVDE